MVAWVDGYFFFDSGFSCPINIPIDFRKLFGYEMRENISKFRQRRKVCYGKLSELHINMIELYKYFEGVKYV